MNPSNVAVQCHLLSQTSILCKVVVVLIGSEFEIATDLFQGGISACMGVVTYCFLFLCSMIMCWWKKLRRYWRLRLLFRFCFRLEPTSFVLTNNLRREQFAGPELGKLWFYGVVCAADYTLSRTMKKSSPLGLSDSIRMALCSKPRPWKVGI